MQPITGALGSIGEDYGGIESNPPMRRAHSISRDKFIEVLVALRSPAASEAADLADIPGRYGIDRGIALAFFVHESGAGTAGIVHSYDTRNWGNLRKPQQAGRGKVIKTGSGQFAKYVSWAAGLEDWCELVLNVYCQQLELTTLGEILHRYAPKADQNDPEAYARKVVQHIKAWQGEMKKKTSVPPKPAPSPARWYVTVTAESGLRIRQGRGTNFPVADILARGERVLVGDDTDGWLWLCDGRGFIAKAFTCRDAAATPTAPAELGSAP
ncbi:MAG: glucosaminidase domain-containing protein [Chloroflexales bacterium]|nr:glucosaminidase domain-containing protein [Chloroflexales bacterium]